MPLATIRMTKKYRFFEPIPHQQEALEADIAKRGVREPIEVDEDGDVLDGHLRLEICRKLGLEPPVLVRTFVSEEEKVEYILKRKLLVGRPGPISSARAIGRLLELRGVKRGQGSAAEKRWSMSATFADISLELGIPERTLRHHLWLADQLADHPELARQVDLGEISSRRALLQLEPKGIAKLDLGDGLSHPAAYSEDLLPVFAELLSLGGRKVRMVLDPFAGTGRIHQLEEWGFETTGVEIEPEWAALHERTTVGNALALELEDESFDAICTSPTYGNRNADHHEAYDGSTRRSYRHDLGRKLHKDNSGRLQWGPSYREFHVKAWREITRVLRAGGLLVLNIKDHIRAGRRQHVAGWHVTTLCRMGYVLLQHEEVAAPGMRLGANGALRFPEQVYLFAKEGV
jgi:SAM-dependent methyltransferase